MKNTLDETTSIEKIKAKICRDLPSGGVRQRSWRSSSSPRLHWL
jgi:hypothetical protein